MEEERRREGPREDGKEGEDLLRDIIGLKDFIITLQKKKDHSALQSTHGE